MNIGFFEMYLFKGPVSVLVISHRVSWYTSVLLYPSFFLFSLCCTLYSPLALLSIVYHSIAEEEKKLPKVGS